MKELVEPQDIIGILGSLDDRMMNPQIHSESHGKKTCVYTDFNGNHCIAGEILHKFGFKLPEVDSYENTIPIDELIYEMGYDTYFTEEAIELLSSAQNIADTRTIENDHFAWFAAKAAMLVRYANGS